MLSNLYSLLSTVCLTLLSTLYVIHTIRYAHYMWHPLHSTLTCDKKHYTPWTTCLHCTCCLFMRPFPWNVFSANSKFGIGFSLTVICLWVTHQCSLNTYNLFNIRIHFYVLSQCLHANTVHSVTCLYISIYLYIYIYFCFYMSDGAYLKSDGTQKCTESNTQWLNAPDGSELS